MNKFLLKKFIMSALIFSLLTLVNLPIFSQAESIQSSLNYIKSKPQNSWLTMARAAAGEEKSSIPSDHLKDIISDKAIDYCAPILAISALNEDPRVFPNQNYVEKLKNFWDGTQLGDPNLLNDEIFGLLALLSAGESFDPIVSGVKNFIISNQNSDGGWGWAPGAESDTNMTSMAIISLLEADVLATTSPIVDGINYLKSNQNSDGGFPYSSTSSWPGAKESDAASDSWVISAIYKLGQNPANWTKNENNPISHLKSLQASDGYFEHQPGGGETAFTPIETAYAMIALAGKSYPVPPIENVPPVIIIYPKKSEEVGEKKEIKEEKIEREGEEKVKKAEEKPTSEMNLTAIANKITKIRIEVLKLRIEVLKLRIQSLEVLLKEIS